MYRIVYFISLIMAFNAAAAQTISIYGIDTADFPVMRAKMFAVDATGVQIKDLTPSVLQLKENGSLREINSITCFQDEPPGKLSTVLVIDISGSMTGSPLNLAETFAKTFINFYPLDQSECAALTFNQLNYFNQDFTTNRQKLLEAISYSGSGGGTDYNRALAAPLTGAIDVAKAGKNKKEIIFITDGLPNEYPNENNIISRALANGITIHCISIGLPAHISMKKFASQTGGVLIENIYSLDDAKAAAHQLLITSVHGGRACDIQWKSERLCDKQRIEIELTWNGIKSSKQYMSPASAISKLSFEPKTIKFYNKIPGVKADTTFTITAVNGDFDITEFKCSNPAFSIMPSGISIKSGETKEVTLSFTPPDSVPQYAAITIENNRCPEQYFALGGWPALGKKSNQLKLTFPNGGEELVTGSDTLITWEGVLPTDTVTLEYSVDGGITWNLITKKASGFKYLWQDIPKPTSDKCLVRIASNGAEPRVQWLKRYGGSKWDNGASILSLNNGKFFIIGTTYSNDGDVSGAIGGADVWAIMLSENGEILWKKNYGGASDDSGISFVEMDDGGFVFCGGTESASGDLTSEYHGDTDIGITKISSSGKVEWKRSLGGSEGEYASDIVKTFDGGVAIVGSSYSQDGDFSDSYYNPYMFILKLDKNGNIEWKKSLNNFNDGWVNHIITTEDGGFIVAGEKRIHVNNGSNSKVWFAKLDNYGSIEWEKLLDGFYWEARPIKTNDGKYMLCYDSPDPKPNQDGYIGFTKFDNQGNILETKIVVDHEVHYIISAIESQSGDYLVVGATDPQKMGYSSPDSINYSFSVAKFDAQFRCDWTKLPFPNSIGYAQSIKETAEGGYIVVGQASKSGKNDNDLIAMRLSPEFLPQADTSDALFSINSTDLTASDIDMGKVVVGEYKDSLITAFIENVGKYPCKIKSMKINGFNLHDFRIITDTTFTLKPGETKSLELHFKPSRIATIKGVIQITTQDGVYNAKISGIGVQPAVTTNPNIIDFGVVKTSKVKDTTVVIIKNPTNESIEIKDVKVIGPDVNQFEIISGKGPYSIPAGEEKELTVRFKPVYVGRASSSIGFYYDGSGSPACVQLYGEGIGGFVYCSRDSARIGEDVEINLLLGGVEPIALQGVACAFKAKIHYLKDLLMLKDNSIKLTEINDSAEVEVSGSIGSTDTLSSLRFKANDSERDSTSFEIISFEWYDENHTIVNYQVETVPGFFKLLKNVGVELGKDQGLQSAVSVYPNPFLERTIIRYFIPQSCETSISIYDIRGKEIEKINFGIQGVGYHEAEYINKKLNAGCYYYILRAGGSVKAGKIMVLQR